MSRPSLYTPEVVKTLELELANGSTIAQACRVANISQDSYYLWKKDIPEFSERMEKAKDEPQSLAKALLIKDIKRGNVDSARWWLERKAKDEGFSARTELTGSDGTPLGYIHSGELKQLENETPALPVPTTPN